MSGLQTVSGSSSLDPQNQEQVLDRNVGFRSKWFKNAAGLRDMLLKQLCIGDLLEFNRGKYKHWAVYVGSGKRSDHEVVHLCNLGQTGRWFGSRSKFREGRVTDGKPIQSDDLFEVWADSTARINNSYDDKSHPYPWYEIFNRATLHLHVDENFDKYHLLKMNCEHFALWIRNGMAESLQVKRFWMRLLETVAFAARDAVVPALAASRFGGPPAAFIAGGVSFVSSFVGRAIAAPED